MPTFAMLAVLLAAPAPNDRSAPLVEVTPLEAPAEAAAPPESAPTPEPPPPAATSFPPPPPVTTPPPPDDRPPTASGRRAAPARPDRPIRWRVDLLGALGTTRIRDTAWRAYDDNRGAFQLSATVRADAPLGSGRVFLGGGATFRRFASYGRIHEVLTYNDVRVREPLAFARVAIRLVEGADIVAQAGGGVSIVDLTMGTTFVASQRTIAPLIDGLAGVNLYLPKRWLPRRGASRVTGGLELAAGYTWRKSVDVRPTLATDEDPIATQGTEFGDVAIRGFAWRLGVFVRFF